MTARSIRRAIKPKAKKLERKSLQKGQPYRIAPGGESPERATLDGSQDRRSKAASSLNAVKTALTGRSVLFGGDDAAEYERHLAAYAEEFAPIGYQESNLVQSIADTDWRLRRIPVLEMALFAKGRLEFAELFDEHEPATRPHLIDAHTFITYEKQIRNLHLQEARLSRRRDKEAAELRRLQVERIQKQPDKKSSKATADGFVFSTREIEPSELPAILMTSPPDTSTAANFS
jgi:hypothetical protein